MSMDLGFALLFLLAAVLIGGLIWMLFNLRDHGIDTTPSDPIRGYCPICAAGLRKGEKIRSSVVEIGNVEIQTRIKGCPYCLGEKSTRKRTCPVCKANLPVDQLILAISDPRVDKRKLAIRGCKTCYPQGF